MEVILLERIERLGQMGDVVTVKPGFARNYLLPRKKALRATKDNLAYFETQRTELEAENLKRKSEAEGVAGKMEGLTMVAIRQAGDSGQLYGSVSARDVTGLLGEEGVTVRAAQVTIPQPIKEIGMHEVAVVLHPEVTVHVTVNVARSAAEAEAQAERAARGEQVVMTADEQAALEAAEEAEQRAAELAIEAGVAEEVFEEVPEELVETAEGDSGEGETAEEDKEEDKPAG